MGVVFACRDKAFSIDRQERVAQPRELFWKWCRFLFLYQYLCQPISVVDQRPEYWRLGNVSSSEENKTEIIFSWFTPSLLQWGAGWVCFSSPGRSSLLWEPGNQPFPQDRAGGKAHLNPHRDHVPSTRIPAGGARPPCCLQGSQQHPSDERERTASAPPFWHSVSQKPLNESLLIFAPTVPLDSVGTIVWKKLSELWLVISPRKGRLGTREGSAWERTLTHPLQSSKYPFHNPPEQGGSGILFSVKSPELLLAPCSCHTWHKFCLQLWGCAGNRCEGSKLRNQTSWGETSDAFPRIISELALPCTPGTPEIRTAGIRTTPGQGKWVGGKDVFWQLVHHWEPGL